MSNVVAVFTVADGVLGCRLTEVGGAGADFAFGQQPQLWQC